MKPFSSNTLQPCILFFCPVQREQLQNIQLNQQKLDTKLTEVLSELAREHDNLQIISTGWVNSTSVLLKKQKQLLLQTETARRASLNSVLVAWGVPCLAVIGWLIIFVLDNMIQSIKCESLKYLSKY